MPAIVGAELSAPVGPNPWRRALDSINPGAGAWLSKAGPDHCAEHLPRLRAWVKELTGRDLAQ